MPDWNEARLQDYIANRIEESLNLEFKDAAALENTDLKKKEITKDVSSFANSDGGTIVYGIAESSMQPRVAERISPVNQNTVPKEWLEQVIANIRPRISGVVIHPVQLDSATTDVAYVVEVPASSTAHQAADKRYYKRYNFESVPMEDYEVRLAMSRQAGPDIRITDVEIRLAVQEVHIELFQSRGLPVRKITITPTIWIENFGFIKPTNLVRSFVGWGISTQEVSRALYENFTILNPEINARFPLRLLSLINHTDQRPGSDYYNFITNAITFPSIEIPVRIDSDWYSGETKMGICLASENMRPKFYQIRLALNTDFFVAAKEGRRIRSDNAVFSFAETVAERPIVSHEVSKQNEDEQNNGRI